MLAMMAQRAAMPLAMPDRSSGRQNAPLARIMAPRARSALAAPRAAVSPPAMKIQDGGQVAAVREAELRTRLRERERDGARAAAEAAEGRRRVRALEAQIREAREVEAEMREEIEAMRARERERGMDEGKESGDIHDVVEDDLTVESLDCGLVAALESGIPPEMRRGRGRRGGAERGTVAQLLRVLRKRGAAERLRLEKEVRERKAVEAKLVAAEKGRKAEREARELAEKECVEMLARMRKFVGAERCLGEER